ncbi:ABC transporter ATP-binding protein [Clostridium botulinum]|uniref:Putative ABC transporter, ATP-binding/permease protein n=1 Tax=Clostridium botulinum (strain Langeland / NCTC 10281 / Type F) TaxID=441772 RepID=A7GEP5_CLOBL|nr:ABC transporter ATP-binding protein [Clostridium botulinum]ABS39646.1 putative ABC transporter, ATP-binding/permease protein [Clostridium botulinum F str. Langeland]ADF99668.1 putative ABC transporter, ATP-binding/permease protein [Clostridium botulinum F str. 230613]KKM42757.1 ABC transporter [Clostridium botulinum]MBY6791725.1 ATP-binding cassette domain-containing protein [Clostridium botulinum]MBY6936962.1 ATP-binding cassette domain-containing protein [Clostridium botulinum]
MLKIIKHLKPFIASIILVLGLLFVQAVCDLSLPDYMSNIVNVGIQQGGVENAVPKVIRKSELDKIKVFLDEEDVKKVEDNYILLDKKNLSKDDLERYLKDYPNLNEEPIYKIDTKDKNIINELNSILAKPILIVGGMEKADTSKVNDITKESATQNKDNKMNLQSEQNDKIKTSSKGEISKENTNPFLKMPKEQINLIKENLDKKFKDMPESMITQSSVIFVKDEYKAIGINTDKLQSNYILNEGFKMLLLALLSMVATVIVAMLAARVAAGLGKNLRRNVFTKVTDFSKGEFDKFSTASLITRSTNDIQQIQTFMVMLLRIVFYAPILGIGGILKVLKTDTSMAWIIAVAVMAILTLVIVLFGMAIPKFKKVQKLIDKINLITRESLIGMLVIRAFNTEKHEEEKFDKTNKELTRTNLFINRTMTMMMPMMMLIMNLITLLIVWVGSHQIDAGAMQVGNMMAFMQYTMQIIMAFLMISIVSIMLPRASVSAQRISEVIDVPITIKDIENPKEFSNHKKGYVEFKNVSFRYEGAQKDVLSNITFTALPGETTAFIGSTGSGKSTLINLIPRFYDVTDGEILIDGVNLKEISQRRLREKIGYVPQKGILFSGTIESNIKYGNESATDKDIEKATRIAQAMEFIESKEQGFKTEVSQGGTNVSGGQKQRLSIARAIVKEPDIYIFDDSFSALDFKTDATLRKALKDETKESTVLIVAQRISTIINADKIIVLDEGKMVGMGTHDELMKNCEVYKEIALSQLSKEELLS